MVKINNKFYKNFKIEIKQYEEIEIVLNNDKRIVKFKKRDRINENSYCNKTKSITKNKDKTK